MLYLVSLAHLLEFLDGVGLGNLTADDGLVFLGQFLHLSFYLREVVLADNSSLRRHDIIKEAILYSRSEAELYARIEFLQCLGEQVGRSVPEGVLAFLVIKLIQFD